MLRDYLRAGFALCAIPAGQKGPEGKGWNLRGETDFAKLRAGNVGLLHALSGTCALDVDHLQHARTWLTSRGIDLDALLADPTAVRIDSGREGRAKLLYALPSPLRSIQRCTYLGDNGRKRKAFELRCASADGTSMQDVLPPSIHPDTGRPYQWAFDPLFADPLHPPTIPDALLALWQAELSAVPERKQLAAPQGATFDQLRSTLAKHDAGAPREDWLKVLMALHHETQGSEDGFALADEWSSTGDNYVGTEDVRKRWDSFRLDRPDSVTLASLRVDAPASPEEFDVIEAPKPQPGRFTPIPADQLLDRPRPGWWVKGVVPRAGLVVIFGEPGSGKSFMMLDLSYAIATGSHWRDRRTSKGRVVYIVAEGAGGFRNRVEALQQQGVPVHALEVITAPPNFLKGDDIRDLIAAIGRADVLVVDTFAQVMPGANENASEDMGKALGHCRTLHAQTGATVVLVHHSGKDATKGARGWSGLKAAADAELEVTRLDESRFLRVSKQKDGEDGSVFAFRLTGVSLGLDEDDEAITSAVVEHTDVMPVKRRREPRGAWEKLVLRVAEDHLGLADEVAVGDVLEAAVAEAPKDDQKRDRRREYALRAVESLVAGGLLMARNNVLRRM